MLTPVRPKEGAALGFFVEEQNPGHFGHNGADEGFQALLTMNWQTGKGAAIMAHSDNGIAVADLALRNVAKEYGWKYRAWEVHPRVSRGKLLGGHVPHERCTEV